MEPSKTSPAVYWFIHEAKGLNNPGQFVLQSLYDKICLLNYKYSLVAVRYHTWHDAEKNCVTLQSESYSISFSKIIKA